ncbi:Kef-type potassium/proton antiporter (CPA2 family) [Nitrosospira sp. Nsp5]|uniref:Kef-type potassium/proton antiporter, CPA2 family n=1 Tax=Nitrosospira multiformis TaxID=1231 RepID=A0ABY0TGU1_9PROT|nr:MULTISPECIES: YbaL family putative K(+) efflux transporter [Nitrosospira]PTR06353.1 Kef-type potassium/proton antiporter (CPA2 family) [Nitrosospira sp. Nsp5]SDQ59377.1 Kef-type potassium/proton antiporter, CPA2 family [Nitrosospira multiformis]
MPHSVTLITTIAVSFGLALLMGLIANRLKLPVLVGYLVAGVILGSNTPGFVADMELSAQLAEIGVILLMFGVGLHFSLDDLLAVRRIALPGALVQIGVATALGAAVAVAWGWDLSAAIVFGVALSTASTVVLLRALEQRGVLKSVNGSIAVGWLVVEDLAMVMVLVLLPPLAGWLGTSAGSPVDGPTPDLLVTLLLTFGKVAIFIALMLIVGKRVFPWLLWHVASTNSTELFILSVIAVAIGIAYGSAMLFGVSFALGAFFAGMVMRESDLSHRAAQESLPLRDAFSVLFFVSVGMLFDPNVLIDQPLRVVATLGIIIIGKSLAAFLLVLAFRYPLNTALTVSASLAQIGEFSFILAALGVSLGLLPVEAQSLILAGAFISITLNPLVFQVIEPAQEWIRSRSRLARVLERSDDPLAELPMSVASSYVTNHVVLVGYGRVGRHIGEALIEQGLALVVADQNREMVEGLRKHGIHAVVGDAAEPAVLIQAHIARAKMLVIAVPDALRARRMIETARMLNPPIEIIVRTHNEEEAALLRRESGGTVLLGEHELALSMTRHVLKKFGK